MKLFRYEDYDVTISEEALAIKCFRKLWNRDRSQGKDKAKSEFGYIYFFCDPRSDYMFLIDEAERSEAIIRDTGLNATKAWEPDDLIKECIETYSKLSCTTTSLLLEDTRKAVEELRFELRNIDMKEETSKGVRVHSLKSVTDTISKVPELIDKLQKAEQLMNKELFEKEARVRGQIEKKIFEDGLM